MGKQTEYRVTWAIEVSADTPQEAAAQARDVQLDPHTTALVFHVRKFTGRKGRLCSGPTHTIDLAKLPNATDVEE